MKHLGFIAPKIEREHHVLGGSGDIFPVICADGIWNDMPLKEYQMKKFETYNCTSFNTLNQIEAYIYKVFGETVNYSDRWLGIIAGTKPPGNDPHIVMEAIRQYGLIPEEMLPWSDDLQNVEEYYSFKGGDGETCYEEGRRWLEKWDFKHKWAFDSNQPNDEKENNLKVSLGICPPTLAVYAWATDERGVYVRKGYDTHWTMMRAFTDFKKIFDSYEPVDKDVDQEIYFCKIICLKKKLVGVNTSLWVKFINWLISIFK